MSESWLKRIIYILLILMPAVSAGQHGHHPDRGMLIAPPSQNRTASDSMVVYDILTKDIRFLPAPYIDSLKTSDHTGYKVGSSGTRVELDLMPPANTSPSGFVPFMHANSLYPVTSFPLSPAVYLYYIDHDGNPQQMCSGVLVAPNVVLTAAHCLYTIQTNSPPYPRMWCDGLYAAPAFDQGNTQESFGVSLAKKYYIFEDWYSGSTPDIGLIELETPIGYQTGWIGFGFNENTLVLDTNNFHCFSYPGTQMPYDSTHDYNGDTMYYHYGRLDCKSTFYIGSMREGIPGMSGSSMFYTDNDSLYISLGVASMNVCGANYSRITRNRFYGLKDIVDNEVTIPISSSTNTLTIYPNPVQNELAFMFTAMEAQHAQLYLFDICGRKILNSNISLIEGENNIKFSLPSIGLGAYTLKLSYGNESFFGKIIKAE